MNYSVVAQKVLDNVGGIENIREVTHCDTRLRLVLKDSNAADKAAIEKIEGVVQLVESGSQFQVVLCGKVNNVYDEFLKLVKTERGTEIAVGNEKQPGSFIIRKIYELFGREQKA